MDINFNFKFHWKCNTADIAYDLRIMDCKYDLSGIKNVCKILL